MMDNQPTRTIPTLIISAAAMLALGSCTVKAPPPAPSPIVKAAPRPVPKPQPRSTLHWQDAPLSNGDWNWSREGVLSVARFGSDVILSCNAARSEVTLLRRGVASGSVPATLLTSTGNRQLSGSGSEGGISITFAAQDTALDAMAYSKGRFALEFAGQPVLYIPSWPEVSRVVEDCR